MSPKAPENSLRSKRIRPFADHYLGGFDQGGGAVAGFQAEFARGVGGDDGGDALLADRKRHLRKQPFDAEIDHAPDELVAPADAAEVAAPALHVATVETFWQKAVNLGLRDAVVPSGRFRRFYFLAVNPLFERWVTDTQDLCGLARGEESLRHGGASSNG